jgi:subtilisin-like proprotein convertase family protein
MVSSARFVVLGAVAAAAIAFSSNASAQCTTGGTGGAIPSSGSGDGAWPGTFPTFPMIGTLSVTPPGGGTVIHSVKVNGLTHTWLGDMHIVLEDPAGNKFNVMHRPFFTGAGFGCADDVGGNYEFVDGAIPCTGAASIPCTGLTTPSGTYKQEFGNWPGSGGVANVGLESIPISAGTWKLYIYDWAGGDSGSLTDWELCFGAPTPPGPGGTPTTCVTGGAGGTYPGGGAVTGVWDTSLPTNPMVSTLAVTIPAGSTKIISVKLNGLSHTYGGDTHAVLTSPGGTSYNLLVLSDSTSPGGGGCGDPLGGNYEVVDAVVGSDPCGGPASPLTCSGVGNPYPAGTCAQTFGTWTSGNAGLFNTPLQSIPITNGSWTLSIYDWYPPLDNGTLTSWDLCFDVVSGPVSYCTAGTTTNGCLASISASANPSVSFANACNVSVANVEGQKNGILFYGLASNAVPWAPGSNSFLCVKPPTQRTGTQTSGGTMNACDGSFALNWNAYQMANPTALGNPWAVGNKAYVQAWFRDPPAVKTTNLSNGLEMTYVP